MMPLEAPRLSVARRQLIVGSVMSLMQGPSHQFATRLYAQMRVRAELLGDPIFRVRAADAAERQRRRRLANRWLAMAADRLDRNDLPTERLTATAQDHADLDAWRANGDQDTPPSIGALRALVAGDEALAFKAVSDSQRMLGWLLDGYRPLIELLRVANLAHRGPSTLPPWDALSEYVAITSRAGALLYVAELLALRGYPDAAALYAGLAQRLPYSSGSARWLRFR